MGLQPHFLTPDPPSGGQASTIRIPHNTAVAPAFSSGKQFLEKILEIVNYGGIVPMECQTPSI